MKLRFLVVFALCAASSALGQTVSTVTISPRGTGRLGAATSRPATMASLSHRARPFRSLKLPAARGSAGIPIPNPAPLPITQPGSKFGGFAGLTNLDQVAAGSGIYAHSQFDLEPPDQGLGVGNGFVVEAVNLAVAVYSAKTGVLLAGPTPLNEFFNMLPEQQPSSGLFGPSLSDPRIQYDPNLKRWFLTILEFDIDPKTGNFLNGSHTEIAVSQGADPTQGWLLYSIDTTDDGTHGTPSNPNCPCFGDQPLSGLDSNGFYITTNEFPTFNSGFNGAQVYAMSKTKLALGLPVPVVHFSNIPLAGQLSYSLQPANTPPGAAYAPNIMFMLSALDFFGVADARIAVWALTNTASLNATAPSVHLLSKVIASEVYATPPPITQKPGAIPLGQSAGDPEAAVESNDDRMNQALYLNGILWGAVNTAVRGPNNSVAVGIAYFAARPSFSGAALSAAMVAQGYVSVAPNSVAYPSIGLNAAGKGLIAFSLIGPDYYPSAAYIPLSGGRLGTSVVEAAAGVAPEDGFTGYPTLFPPSDGTARWGDYSAAVADETGAVWFGTEYIPSTFFRTLFANWGTFIGRLVP